MKTEEIKYVLQFNGITHDVIYDSLLVSAMLNASTPTINGLHYNITQFVYKKYETHMDNYITNDQNKCKVWHFFLIRETQCTRKFCLFITMILNYIHTNY